MVTRLASLPMWTGGDGSRGLRDCDADRCVRGVAPLCVCLLAAALLVVTTLGFPSQTLADDAPGRLEDNVESLAQQHAEGPVEWARYVETSADTAAGLLGKSRDQLFEATPDRVYLVVMHGDFSKGHSDFLRDYTGPKRGSYLAFLYWHDGQYWNATDFTLLKHPVPLRSAGVPREIESFALAHPTLNHVREDALAYLLWFGPAALIAVSAVLCGWKRHSRWPYLLAACVAVVVAGWQTYVTVDSVAGRPWDPVFHGIKIGILAVVVSVDLAAAFALLRARSGLGAAGQTAAWLFAGLLLLVVAAVLYIPSLYVLAVGD